MAFAMLCMTSAMAQSKPVTTTAAGTLASSFIDEEKATVKELIVSGPLNKTDFDFINTLTALETLDIRAVTIAGETRKETRIIDEVETLIDVTYPADVLPVEALHENKSITMLVLPASIVSIGETAVSYTNVADVDFTACSKLKSIEREAFHCNDYLCSINLSGLKALETIGYNAFNTCGAKATGAPLIDLSGCSALKEISDYAFCNIKLNVNLNYSGCTSLTTIGTSAFQNVYAPSVDLGDCSALETISNKAYYTAVALKGAMTTLKIPAGLKEIKDQAFNNQKKLASVTSLAVTPPTLGTNKPFYLVDDVFNATLTVPAGSKAAYEANEGWKKFKEIVETGGSSVKEFEAAIVSIWAADGTIYVKNAEEGSVVNVFNASGALVATGVVAGGEAALQVSDKGVYIVKAADATAKVRL